MTEMEFETSMPGAIVIAALVLVIFTFMFTSVGETQKKKIIINEGEMDKGLTKVLTDVQQCYGMGLAVSNVFMKTVKSKSVGMNCSLFCSRKELSNFKDKVTRKIVRYKVHENEDIKLKVKSLPEDLEANAVYQIYLEDTGAMGKLSRIFGGSGKIKIRRLKEKDCSDWKEEKD